MRYISIILLTVILFGACKKDKFTSVPQIEYKKISPNVVDASNATSPSPVLTIHVTDTEGDFSLSGTDTAKIYLKNLLTGLQDSLLFPSLRSSGKNFDADVLIKLDRVLDESPRPRPKTDTLYFEVYIKDIAKNKSNVIRTGDPVYFVFP